MKRPCQIALWPLTTGVVPAVTAVAAAGFFVWNMARFFPNPAGHLGYDYGLFLPWMIAGFFWETTNGRFAPPEFLPSFCGGVPFLFNPQSMFYSLPQWLLGWIGPVRALLLSWLIFGLAGGLGTYGLLRRVFLVSVPAAVLGGSIFLLNGFFTTRMIIGHATYHGVMLLPLIALALFTQGSRWTAVLLRIVIAGLLLAYLFYSGGTNIILPMLLALAVLALMVCHAGRWDRNLGAVAVAAGLLCLALSAYKLLPALAFAGNVVRPVALRMSGDLLSLIGGAAMSLFVPQVLGYLDPGRLIVDRVELEYGVGIVPLVALVAAGWAGIRPRGGTFAMAGIAVLLVLPILVNFDGLGLRALVLRLPIVRSMSIMLRFWFAYIPVLCVLTALALDRLTQAPARRAWWSAAGVAVTIVQCGSTDMRYYLAQPYDPGPINAAYDRVRSGGEVPAITRIDDPWAAGGERDGASRNDAVVEGISAFPCYEPMFGYRMQVFRVGRLSPGPVLANRDGRLNLKDPACYVFPAANGCAPGDEFLAGRQADAEDFADYRSFHYVWPTWEYVAAGVSVGAAGLSVLGLLIPLIALGRRR